MIEKFQNASYERQTQTVNTNKSNTYSAFAERIIEPKTYISYNDEKKIEIEKIILIQKNFRRYLWQKLIRKSAKEWRFVNTRLALLLYEFVKNFRL